MHKDKDLEMIYNDIFGDAIEYMRDYDVQAIAATYMAIAMRLYKTHLDEVKSLETREYDTCMQCSCDRRAINGRLVVVATHTSQFYEGHY